MLIVNISYLHCHFFHCQSSDKLWYQLCPVYMLETLELGGVQKVSPQ